MKKYVFILIFISFFWSAFAFEGISKVASSTDGYTVRLYQIDKSVNPDQYEFYVQLKSNNSQEFFTWCFDNLNEAMEHFEWLKTINVVEIKREREGAEALGYMVLFGTITLAEAQKQAQKLPTKEYDKRKDWRNYSWEATVSSNGYTNYWISKKQILNKNDWSSWR